MSVCQKCLEEIDPNEPRLKCPSCGRWYHRYASCMDARDNGKYYSYCYRCGSKTHNLRYCPHCGALIYAVCDSCK